jgi:hypothetical protein
MLLAVTLYQATRRRIPEDVNFFVQSRIALVFRPVRF